MVHISSRFAVKLGRAQLSVWVIMMVYGDFSGGAPIFHIVGDSLSLDFVHHGTHMPRPQLLAKGCPYQVDGGQLDSTLLILPIDGMEGQAANFSIFLQKHCHLAKNCRT